MVLVRDRFTFDGESFVDGWHDPSVRWNGFACPLFDVAGVRAIADMIASFPGSEDFTTVTINEWGTVFYESPDGDEYVCDPVIVDGAELYPVGSHGWVWQAESDGVDA